MKRLKPFLVVIAVLLTLSMSGVATVLFNDLVGLRFLVLGRAATGNIAIVAIDAPSLANQGVWPWPRSLHAKLVDRLIDAGASDIAFDVDFSSASSPAEDQIFEDALRRGGGSIALPTFIQFSSSIGHDQSFVSKPLPRFAAHSWSAAVNVRPDLDGKIRRYSIGQMLPGGVAPSIAVFIAGRTSIEETNFLIDFGIRSQTVPIYSFSDVLNHPETLKQLEGKKVIVGATAVELDDRVTIPGGRVIPGVVLQALAAESLIQGRDLKLAPSSIPLSIAICFSALVAILYRRVSLTGATAVLIIVPLGSEVFAYALQATTPYVLDTVPLHLSALVWAAVIGASEFNLRDLLRRIAERRFHQVSMSIADGLICTDELSQITLWNQAAERMFGYQSSDVIGRDISTVVQSLQREPWSIAELTEAACVSEQGGRELLGKRRDGSEFLIEATISAWDADKGLNYSVAVRDISIRKREEQRIRYLSERDPLTGLYNRRSFIQNLEARADMAVEIGSEVGLLLIDVDRFKEINDTLGHAEGDHVLRKAAEIVQKAAGADGCAARLGGDEFAVTLSSTDATEAADRIARAIIGAFAENDLTSRASIKKINVSIGVSIYPRNSDSAEGAMADADLAMYQAKSTEDSSVRFFDQSMRDAFESQIILAEELKVALTQGQFELHYQPQFDLRSNQVVGAEALIRWRHPTRGLVSPGQFIGLLNSLPISNDVSAWTLQTACLQAREWQRGGWNIRVGVNLSPAQFRTMDLPALAAQVLNETGLPANLLELEVTEEIVIEDDVAAKETFDRLHALGVHLAWDDFGTGYGSLIYLKKFPLDRLKIDQSFVRDLREGTHDFAIVEYTIRLCQVLGLSVTAEGIETSSVLPLLARLGCDEGQGYYYSRPVSASEFATRFLTERKYDAA